LLEVHVEIFKNRCISWKSGNNGQIGLFKTLRLYMTIEDYTRLYRTILDYTGLYRIIQDFIGLFRTTQDYTI